MLKLPTDHESSRTRRLIVIDDDELSHKTIQLIVPSGWSTTHFTGCPEDPKLIANADAALVDMHLTGNVQSAEGIEVIRELKTMNPNLDVIAMSGDLSPRLMRDGLNAGALLFLAKPLHPEELVARLTKTEARLIHTEALNRTIGRGHDVWVGESEASVQLRRQISELAGESGPVLISGETGSGKEVVATLLHSQEPPRGRRPFIAVNCAALPESLFESELFGHTKGAFTGADQNKMGLIEAAHGGDLFLDEIQELSLSSQAKLLRFLETGEVRRVGASASVHPKVRVLAATNKDLDDLVAAKLFREDLLWRLKRFQVQIPPLRDRTDDVRSLVKHFTTLDPVRKARVWSDEAIDFLRGLPFKGNTRELKRIVEQTLLYSPLPIIECDHLIPHCPKSPADLSAQGSFQSSSSSAVGRNSAAPEPQHLSTITSMLFDHSLTLADRIQKIEALILQSAVDAASDLEELGDRLQVSRSHLYRKLKDYGIERRKGQKE